jgi:hypothetical protein
VQQRRVESRQAGCQTNFFEMMHATSELEPVADAPTPADRERAARLAAWFREHGSVLVGFSGASTPRFSRALPSMRWARIACLP